MTSCGIQLLSWKRQVLNMGFAGTEIKHLIFSDAVNYTLGDTGTGVTELIVKTPTLWVAAYLVVADESYNYKPVIVSSSDGTTWTDMVYPYGAGVNHGYIKMAVGTDGSIHVFSMDANDMDKFYYAVYSSGAWSSLETVNCSGNVSPYPSFKLDSNNKPHVILELFAGGVETANKVSGTWSSWDTIVASGFTLSNADMASDDTIHVNLVDIADFHVWYTTGVHSGTWLTPEEVHGGACNYSAICCNGTTPVIACSYNDIVYVYKKSGTWSNEDLTITGLSANRLSIKAADTFLYLAYEVSPSPSPFTNTQWYYTDNSTGSWATPVCVTNDDTNNWSSGTLWTDGSSFGLLAQGDYAYVAAWLITAVAAPSVDKWGTLQLNIYEYTRDNIEQFGEENDLVPYVGVTTAQSRLLQAGRGRERRTVSGWAEKTDFDSIEADYEAFTQRKVEFHDGTSITLAIIEELSGERKKGSTRVWYKAKFLEVTL